MKGRTATQNFWAEEGMGCEDLAQSGIKIMRFKVEESAVQNATLRRPLFRT
jgi:hypothetical protein